MRPFGSPEELERRRLRAVEMLQQGLGPSQIARTLGVDYSGRRCPGNLLERDLPSGTS